MAALGGSVASFYIFAAFFLGKFAVDSPLEGTGFELLVPRQIGFCFETEGEPESA
jgi:hypothetical protein